MKRAVALAWALAAALGATSAAWAEPGAVASSSIYQLNLPIDGAIIALATAATVVPYALTSHFITPSCPCPRGAVNAFDRGAIDHSSNVADWAGTVTVGLALLAPPVADWLVVPTVRTWGEDMVVFTEALMVNGALVTGTKYLVQRPIPRVYADPALAGEPGNYRAFYSGHTAVAFAALSAASVTIDRRYGLTWAPWAVTLLVGTSVAVERVYSGLHFNTDVIVGAVVGTTIGTIVPWLHLRSRQVRLSAWRPELGAGSGLALVGRFQ